MHACVYTNVVLVGWLVGGLTHIRALPQHRRALLAFCGRACARNLSVCQRKRVRPTHTHIHLTHHLRIHNIECVNISWQCGAVPFGRHTASQSQLPDENKRRETSSTEDNVEANKKNEDEKKPTYTFNQFNAHACGALCSRIVGAFVRALIGAHW